MKTLCLQLIISCFLEKIFLRTCFLRTPMFQNITILTGGFSNQPVGKRPFVYMKQGVWQWNLLVFVTFPFLFLDGWLLSCGRTAFSFLFFFLLLGPPLWHMEAPRLQARGLVGATAAGLHRHLSRVCDLRHSSQQPRSLTHWARPGIEPPTIPSWNCFCCATRGTPYGRTFKWPVLKREGKEHHQKAYICFLPHHHHWFVPSGHEGGKERGLTEGRCF